ncbi:phosphoribosylanthranilate isomerase [Kaustia mangrovi]|uniref:N-(5'-phosphoribosyl)anthranilate isomerase n=1 Tax=Kaustia mangrovi TaxID=2593653 RepID=A0A7S8HBF1_9HYPH|nr:phosphoribosylanthranilate isomerase [Kaustia mangrovi]QPC42567.1 phosphoribosylanthranilate isomerase [Kaustia mangrovi]
MAVDIKICGLTSAAALDAALEAGADLVGLVFYPPSPRHVSLDTARELAARAKGRARIVALTVDADDATLREIVEAIRPDFIQAHGHESPERVREIAERFATPVIKAVKVRDAGDVRGAEAYGDAAALILYDAKAPENLAEALPGGNGITFDWHLMEADGAPRAGFMLSGGLTAENVARAIAVTGAPIVDVSSGVESAPGVKDARLIRKFIEAARAAR